MEIETQIRIENNGEPTVRSLILRLGPIALSADEVARRLRRFAEIIEAATENLEGVKVLDAMNPEYDAEPVPVPEKRAEKAPAAPAPKGKEKARHIPGYFDDDTKRRAVAMVRAGRTRIDAAKAVGASNWSVNQWCKSGKYEPAAPDPTVVTGLAKEKPAAKPGDALNLVQPRKVPARIEKKPDGKPAPPREMPPGKFNVGDNVVTPDGVGVVTIRGYSFKLLRYTYTVELDSGGAEPRGNYLEHELEPA